MRWGGWQRYSTAQAEERQFTRDERPILKGRSDDEKAFWAEGFVTWLKRDPVPMSRCQTRFTSSDLRKFAEQHGDVIGWEQSNRAYILTHDVSGVDWAHYKHPLPEHVYDVYMRYWET